MARSIKLNRLAWVISGMLLLAGCNKPADSAADAKPELKTPKIAVNLPVEHNTPDGMAVDAEGNIILSCPNFNDQSYPAWLMKITPDDKLEEYFEMAVHPETKKACPLGIAFGSDGNLYIADCQAIGGDDTYKSRLLKLTIEDGKPVKCESVVEGFVFSNAVACHGDSVYVSETKFAPAPPEDETTEDETTSEAAPKGPIPSGVYRFKISELDGSKPIQLEKGGNDPHLVCKLSTNSEEWPFGANGLGFAADGTMYVCNFGDAELIAVSFDEEGKATQKVVAAGDPMKSADGLKVDAKTGLVYIADFVDNAVHCVDPKTGKVTVIAQNDMSDGKDGQLDKCSEVCLRGNKIYVANIDLPFGGNAYDEPYTVSVIEMDEE